MTKPLFIWAGGKNKMLKHYISHIILLKKILLFLIINIRILFSQNEVELSVLEDMGINTSMLQPGIPENEEHERQDEAYVQGDQDREDEGLDDPDNDGDYKEN